MVTPRSRCSGAVLLVVATSATAVGAATVAHAVETDMAINTTAIDFGGVAVGTTASVPVTLTNTGSDPFGPINMFGGAPPTAEYGASQNCQGQTLPAGGSCSVSYSFSPGSTGTFNDTSSFTISETSSQSDGEDFSVSLTGSGVGPSAATTTGAPTTSTSTTSSPTTASPTTTTAADDSSSPGPTSAATTDVDTTTTTPTTTTPGGLPLTGAALPRPAIVVKVDNVDAEPQSGLNQADIVFEAIVEGSATRFAAVFHSVDASVVGPVRSARAPDVDLAVGLGDPAIVISGANDHVTGALAAAGVEVVAEGSAGLFRRDDLPAPHNLFVDLRAVWPTLTGSSADVEALFEYLPPGQVADGTPVTFTEMRVGAYDVRWDWDPGSGSFVRSQLGHAHELADGRASTTNVVVLVVDYTVTADGIPEAHTVGSGQAFVYRDGLRLEGTWSRATASAPFTLEAGGQPILLAPGRTWVELVSGEHGLHDG